MTTQKIIMKGGMGIDLSFLTKELLEYLQKRLTLSMKTFNEGDPPIIVQSFHIAGERFWVPRFFDWVDFWPKITNVGWQWSCPFLDYDLKSLFTPKVEDRQPEAIEKVVAHLKQYSGGIAVLPTGIGKCLGRGTPVIRADGRVVPVEDVRAGDRLMGPDGTARTVLSTNQGRGPLYRIDPVKGEPWVCNDMHVLTLVHASTGDVIDIPLDEWLAASKTFRHVHKQFSVGVDEFENAPEAPLVDPYFLGLWFGDGTKAERSPGQLLRIEVTKPDPAVATECERIAVAWGIRCRTDDANGTQCMAYHLVGEKGRSNPLLDAMRRCVGPHQVVPDEIIRGSRQTRLAFLAGFCDADAELASKCFVITQKRSDWARAAWWIARSLGFCATITQRSASNQDGFEGEYWVVVISGHTDRIPTRIPRKQAELRKQKKDASRTGIKATSIGEGDYFGFTLDGDGRFLLSDFTVTHNTFLSLEIARHFQTPIVVLVHKGDMIDNWVEHAEAHLGVPPGDVAIIKESSYIENKPVTICSIQTLLSREFSDDFYAQFGFVIADECIAGDALIETDQGQVPLSEIPTSGATQVLCYDEHFEQWTFRRILRWIPQGRKKTLTVTTRAGRIRCTPDHLFLTQRGWREAQKIQPGDLIYTPVNATDHPAWTTSFRQIMSVTVDQGPGVPVFDLEIEEHHNFVANGILVHNCHHYGAAQWSKVIGRFPARYRLGISANPIRDDGLDPIIRWNFGKVAFGIYKPVSEKLPLVCLTRWTPDVPYKEGSYHDFKEVFTEEGSRWVKGRANAMKYAKVLSMDTRRNSWLVGKIIDARSKGRRVLIFTKLRAHLEVLHDEFVVRWTKAMLDSGGDPKATKIVKLWGGLKDRELKAAMKGDVTFTTYGFSKEATNLSQKDTLVLATPAGDPLQTVGRLRDKGSPDRMSFFVLDPFEGNKYSFKKAMERGWAYRNLGIEVKRYEQKR